LAECGFSVGFELLAADGVFIPKLFDACDEGAFLGVEIAFQFLADDVVQLVKDQGSGDRFGELAVDRLQQCGGGVQALLQGGYILLQRLEPRILKFEDNQMGSQPDGVSPRILTFSYPHT